MVVTHNNSLPRFWRRAITSPQVLYFAMKIIMQRLVIWPSCRKLETNGWWQRHLVLEAWFRFSVIWIPHFCLSIIFSTKCRHWNFNDWVRSGYQFFRLLICFLAWTIDSYMNKLQLVVLRKLAIYTVYHLILSQARTCFWHTKILLQYSLHVPTSLQLGSLTTDNVFFGNMCVRIFQELAKRHLR